MEDIVKELRELGVYIPEGLDNTQLLSLAKLLCPWTLSISHVGDLSLASTRKGREGGEEFIADTPAEAALGLILQHLQGKRYTAADTRYKQDAVQYRKTNRS